MLVLDGALPDGGGTTLTAGVELDGRSVVWITHLMFEWELLLLAPDPLKYGAPVTGQTSLAPTAGGGGLVYPLTYPRDYGEAPGVTPGLVFLPNGGTAAYLPTVRVTGPVVNPVVTLVESGSSIRYTGSVVAGQWLDFDCANRVVLLNGVSPLPLTLLTIAGDWLTVPVGGGTFRLDANTASPSSILTTTGYQGAWV